MRAVFYIHAGEDISIFAIHVNDCTMTGSSDNLIQNYKLNGQRDRTEDGQTGGEHGLTQTAGKNEEGDDFFSLFPLLSSFFLFFGLLAISHSFSLAHSLLRNLMPLIIF